MPGVSSFWKRIAHSVEPGRFESFLETSLSKGLASLNLKREQNRPLLCRGTGQDVADSLSLRLANQLRMDSCCGRFEKV
jgi:hypothetical protein